MLCGKAVKRIVGHGVRQIMIEFDDGSRLFADSDASLELSIELSTDLNRPDTPAQ